MNKNFLKITTILCSLAAFPTGLLAEEYTKNGKTVDVQTTDQTSDTITTTTGDKRQVTKVTSSDGTLLDEKITKNNGNSIEIYNDNTNPIVYVTKDSNTLEIDPTNEGSANYSGTKTVNGTTTDVSGTVTRATSGNTTTTTISPDDGSEGRSISKTSETNGMNKYQTSSGKTRIEKQHHIPKKN